MNDPKALEEQAYRKLYEEHFEDAFKMFRKAGQLYREHDNHAQAALCFASAGSCWGIKSGERSFSHSASSYEDAANEALKEGDLEYASILFRHAARHYERDMESMNFSECFYKSKECHRRFLTYQLLSPGRIRVIAKSLQPAGFKGLLHRTLLCLSLTVNYFLWGYGERPFRALFVGAGVIFLFAFFYQGMHLSSNGIITQPHYVQALYFSTVTFTTVGYGDLTPVGIARLCAGIEAFCGLFIPSLFMIGLSRKYLRI